MVPCPALTLHAARMVAGVRTEAAVHARRQLNELLRAADALPDTSRASRVLVALACRLQLVALELDVDGGGAASAGFQVRRTHSSRRQLLLRYRSCGLSRTLEPLAGHACARGLTRKPWRLPPAVTKQAPEPPRPRAVSVAWRPAGG